MNKIVVLMLCLVHTWMMQAAWVKPLSLERDFHQAISSHQEKTLAHLLLVHRVNPGEKFQWIRHITSLRTALTFFGTGNIVFPQNALHSMPFNPDFRLIYLYPSADDALDKCLNTQLRRYDRRIREGQVLQTIDKINFYGMIQGLLYLGAHVGEAEQKLLDAHTQLDPNWKVVLDSAKELLSEAQDRRIKLEESLHPDDFPEELARLVDDYRRPKQEGEVAQWCDEVERERKYIAQMHEEVQKKGADEQCDHCRVSREARG